MLKLQSKRSAMQGAFSITSILQWAGKVVIAIPVRLSTTNGIRFLTRIPLPQVALHGDQSDQLLTAHSGSKFCLFELC